MKVLFMGTPEFAAASLSALLLSRHEVVGVVTQPDRSLKHGKTEICAVKKLAEKAGLKIFQPVRIRAEADKLKDFGADIAVTAAYGQILNADVLNAFKYGVINVHASMLPKYRGASPIQSAIAAGDRKTGVTIMKTALGVDTGDILAVAVADISDDDTAGTLTKKLSELGAELLIETLDDWDNKIPVKQDDTQATHCRMISKADQYIDFSEDSDTVVNNIRALSPSPCAKTVINGEIYKIYKAEALHISGNRHKAGEILRSDGEFIIACGNGAISVKTIQAPSKRAMDISDFLRGKKLNVGVICEKLSQ